MTSFWHYTYFERCSFGALRTRKQRNVIEVATTISSWPFAFFFSLSITSQESVASFSNYVVIANWIWSLKPKSLQKSRWVLTLIPFSVLRDKPILAFFKLLIRSCKRANTKNLPYLINSKIHLNRVRIWIESAYALFKVRFEFGLGLMTLVRIRAQFEKIQKFDFDCLLSYLLFYKDLSTA